MHASERPIRMVLTLLMSAYIASGVRGQAPVSHQEAAGIEEEQAGRLREAFDDYLAALEKLPDPPPLDVDQRLRESIIRIVLQLNPPPAVSEEAERRLIRGQMAVKVARNSDDLKAAASEFEQALRAPWLAVAYFNLALVAKETDGLRGCHSTFQALYYGCSQSRRCGGGPSEDN